MQTNSIRTSEEDSGLWGVYKGEQRLGYIWEPDAQARIMGKAYRSHRKFYSTWQGDKYCPEEPRFLALDDWNGCMPGNPIEACATWHKALSAIVQYRKGDNTRHLVIYTEAGLLRTVCEVPNSALKDADSIRSFLSNWADKFYGKQGQNYRIAEAPGDAIPLFVQQIVYTLNGGQIIGEALRIE